MSRLRVHLWLALVLLASAGAVVTRLTEIGAAKPVDGRGDQHRFGG